MNRNQNSQNPNRDPITGEPASHPVGTAAGAASGGVAGAAVGMAGGPLGAGVGAAIGAVAGGLAGKAAGEHFNPTNAGELGRFIDFTVADINDEKVGTVDAVWEDHTGQPSYLAIRTGWLGFGKAHVIPAQRAEVSETTRKIRLPYLASQIKSAPSFDSQDDLTEESEYTISSHFGSPERPNAPKRPDDGVAPLSRAKGDETRVKLKEEKLKVGKREVDAGGIRLRKIIRTESVNQPVELTHEDVVIERVPLDSTDSTAETTDFADDEIFIPLRREEAVVQKVVQGREEICIAKQKTTERQDITDSVRREEVAIEGDDKIIKDANRHSRQR
jgi:uncharacterized protein (TIGR02271 family)